jgi:hypothetical protein
MHYAPEDGKRQVGEKATLLFELRQRLTPEDYEQDKRALKEFLCGYFSSVECCHAQGSSICPMKATPKGGKVLKVRWGYPGCGKCGAYDWLSSLTAMSGECTSPRRLIAAAIRRMTRSWMRSARCDG